MLWAAWQKGQKLQNRESLAQKAAAIWPCSKEANCFQGSVDALLTKYTGSQAYSSPSSQFVVTNILSKLIQRLKKKKAWEKGYLRGKTAWNADQIPNANTKQEAWNVREQALQTSDLLGSLDEQHTASAVCMALSAAHPLLGGLRGDRMPWAESCLSQGSPRVSLWMANLSVPMQLLPNQNAGPYTSPNSGGGQWHFESIAAASYCFWSFCPSVLNSGLFFFFLLAVFITSFKQDGFFSSIKWHITLPSCVINFMDFSISCHDEPKFSNIIRLWLCISRHLMSVPITKIYHFLNLMASARGSFRLFQCGLSFLKSINYFVFKANLSCSLSGSFHGQNIVSYIQWLVI